jgi:hypothetical protein
LTFGRPSWGTLVSTRAADTDLPRLDSILNESAVNLRDQSVARQKTGWKSFDPASEPYGAEEVRKERQVYGGHFAKEHRDGPLRRAVSVFRDTRQTWSDEAERYRSQTPE